MISKDNKELQKVIRRLKRINYGFSENDYLSKIHFNILKDLKCYDDFSKLSKEELLKWRQELYYEKDGCRLYAENNKAYKNYDGYGYYMARLEAIKDIILLINEKISFIEKKEYEKRIALQKQKIEKKHALKERYIKKQNKQCFLQILEDQFNRNNNVFEESSFCTFNNEEDYYKCLFKLLEGDNNA